MQLNVISDEGKSINTLTVSDDCFNHQFNEPLVHQIVVAYLAKARAGTQAQKTRSEVRGGGKKPWRQKGTGRARAGSIRSPLWRKGGVIFAAKPRDYEQKINRKMYRSAMRAILSELIRQDRLKVINDFSLEEAKTKQLFGKLQSLNVNDVLIVIDAEDSKLTLAARNIPNVDVCLVNLINPINLINHENVMITLSAFKKIEELLA